jgi:diguanylate cyclase (GGDEF)-like protein
MKLNIKTKVYSFFVILALVGTFNLAMMVKLESIVEDNYQWVIHTYQVIEESEKLLGYLRDAETGQRGYLLTSDEKYLQPYLSGTALSKKSVSFLYTKTQDNPTQQQRLDIISRLIADKFSELAATLELHKAGREEEALQMVLSDQGKRIMDELRDEVDQFNYAEHQLLSDREGSFAMVQTATKYAFLIETVVFVFAMTFLAWRVRKDMLLPLLKLTDAAQRFRFHTRFEPIRLTNKDEIGELAAAFNSMAKAVNTSARDILKDHNRAQTERDQAVLEAITDPLTGLSNRNFFYHEVAQHIKLSRRYVKPLSLLMIDIDHFKKINDQFGHLVGDEVLRVVADNIKTDVRETDMAIRFGGEEFIIIFDNISIEEAKVKAEEIRRLIESLEIPDLNGKQVTVSIGLSQLNARDRLIDDVIARADEALYEAKNNGRNQVRVFQA